ncbi:hypothetical protein PSECIP111951_00374 [Pseudoalteromonas holothuriae]|uniref:Macrodomain Ori protein n=1 Tax=Pseudoalteromonas holothuriae TaxID=2963714 RepID=A0ABM9GDR3_9GAMM|nr:DUF413 domain-containing protein [Pseudoalteromonas sp. CIP111951]CAH9051350.1 hypothetical protein PSECIP111951_00374 [Pseudoalteromonas sp. CIP111951]
MDQNLINLRNAFVSPRAFYDDANFPRGFSRSGHFTLLEAQVLEQHGVLLKSLYNKQSEPQNSFQLQFVNVMEQGMPSSNVIERTWTKYLKLTTCKNKFHTLFGRSRSVPDSYAPLYSSADDDL